MWDDASTGGTGAWDTTSSLWLDNSSWSPQTWTNGTPNGDTALFQSGTGTVTIEAGLAINVNNLTFSTSGYVIAGDIGATLNLDGTAPTIDTGADATISAVISGADLTKSGAGRLTLTNANTYTGLTTITDGTLAYGASDVISTGDITVIGAAAVLDLGLDQTDEVGTITLDGGGVITGSGTSKIVSTGSLEMKGGTVSVLLGGEPWVFLHKTTGETVTINSSLNTYTGGTILDAGVLSFGTIADGGVASSIGNSTNAAENLVFNGGTLQYTGLTSSTDRNFTISSGQTAVIDVLSGTENLQLYGASEATDGGLTKIGAGTLTILGVNAYTGVTNVSEGTLLLQGADRVSAQSALNLSGGNLSTDSSQTLQSLTLSANSTLNLNNSGNVSFNGGTNGENSFQYFGDHETLTVSNYNVGVSPYALRFLGDWTGDAGFNTFAGNTTINGFAPEISFDGNYTNLTVVPEPSSVVAALSMIALIGYRERQSLAGAWRKMGSSARN